MNRGRNQVVASMCALLVTSGGCGREEATRSQQGHPETTAATIELPSFGTVIVDFSASFAPLSQSDRLALKETARALADLAVQVWSPPTTIVWRKIGAASAMPPPMCDVLEFNRSIIGAAGSADRLRSQLDACAESVISASRKSATQEPYTDISGGIMMAVENWKGISGHKVLIVLSDFLEDLPKGAAPVNLKLNGESVLLLHRPGVTDAQGPSPYLERVVKWQQQLLASGAKSVAALPIFWTTAETIKQTLTQKPDKGTSIALINDLAPDSTLSPVMKRTITTLASALAKQATAWAEPVTANWFGTARPAYRTVAVAPLVYTPRLVRRANELNTAGSFKDALEETGWALQSRQAVGNGDVDGALKLITNGYGGTNQYLILISEFNEPAPSLADLSLRGKRMLLVYRSRNAKSGSQFFDRLHQWQEFFRSIGAIRVCALDIMTLTESAVHRCLQP